MARGKRPAAKAPTTSTLSNWRSDGWANVLTALGQPDRDRSLATTFECTPITAQEARELWRGNDLAARIIEEKPKQAFRPGWDIKIAADVGKKPVDPEKVKETTEAMQTRLEELKAKKKCIKAAQYARAYGGSAIYPVINDSTRDLAQPLAEKGRIPTIKHLHVFSASELQPVDYYDDIDDPKFGQPRTYRLNPRNGRASRGSEKILHETRLIIFNGIRVANDQHDGAETGWGDSCLTRCSDTLRDFGASWGYAAHLISEFAHGIYKLAGLAELMAQNGEKVVAQRIAMLDMLRSVLRSTVIDKDDDFQRTSTPLTGLPDMMQLFATRLSAAADMPVTVLMGVSPAGLNATGESDIRNWYDKIDGERAEEYLDQLERLIQLVFLSNDGPTKGVEPEQWSAEFKPLYQQSEKEKIETRSTQAEVDVAYINAGVYTPEEVAKNRFGGDTYSYEMTIDFEERERLAKELDEQETDALEEMRQIASGETADPAAPSDSNRSPANGERRIPNGSGAGQPRATARGVRT